MHKSFRPSSAALGILVLTVLSAWAAAPVAGQSLRGSAASLDRQNVQAQAHSFTYLETPAQVRRFVDAGYLVPVRPNRDFDVHNVSFPYARPEARLFIERLAAQYRGACGEKLVVTSLTRPISHQPANASSRSVHPTGMAIDLRRSANARCRTWLEATLLSLEAEGVLEAIEERRPPHYHIALYPNPYATYLAQRTGTSVVAMTSSDAPAVELEWVTHRVGRGDNLTSIARRYDTTVSRIRSENGLPSSRILAGQELRIPVYRESRVASAESGVERAAPADSRDRGASAVASSRTTAEDPDQSIDAGAGPSDDGAPDAGPSSAAAGSAGLTHRIARGESLWSIARLYGVAESELRQANGIRGSRILVGQELTIPGAARSAPSGRTLEHRVSRGESLWTIARTHGVAVEEIQRQNGIGGSRIQAGQTLLIPVDR